jgi:hypothetical protein
MLISTLLPLEMSGAQTLRDGLPARGVSVTRWRQTGTMRVALLLLACRSRWSLAP